MLNTQLLAATIQKAEIEPASAGKCFGTGKTSFPGRRLKHCIFGAVRQLKTF